ncbi:MAG: hypothetical protein WD696_22325 [Bryobacteraceae bacterium]
MLIENPRGKYSFLRGISPYSAGAIASPGFEIVHARLQPALPLRRGFEAVDGHLRSLGLPRQALCAMELRSPRPFTFQGFSDFNAGYVKILKSWDILQDGLNPVARTNVAPELDPPAEPSIYAFSYTVPLPASAVPGRPTFIVAGAGELPEGTLDPHDVVRRGELTADALVEKARFVWGLMDGRLRGLGVGWQDVTVSELYTVHDIGHMLAKEILPPMGAAKLQGLTWHFARPPIVSIEYEMDLRGCRREVIIP